jgi:hypothetical protein
VDDVYKNLNEFKIIEEEKRLILERETFDKMNRIEKNYNDNRQKIYKKLVKKNITERDNYINSLNKYLKEQEQLTEIKREKAFKKYQGYYFTMKAINEKREEKSIVMKDKLKEKQERLKELEKKEQSRTQIIHKKIGKNAG